MKKGILTAALLLIVGLTLVHGQQNEGFFLDEQGVVHSPAGLFTDMSEYVASDYFRTHGMRCLLKTVPAEIKAKRARVGSDCDESQTVIRSAYWPGSAITVPVVFHIITRRDGTGAVTDQQIAEQVRVLNEDFAALDGTYGENGFNTHLNFVLAGITRTANDTWFNDRQEEQFKTELAWDVDRYVNVYTNSASGYLGYAYLPTEAAGTILDGVVMLYEVIGGRNNGFEDYNQGRTLVHELGHYFGLLHTFDGGCSNTYHSGDLIVDTNSEAEEHYDCVQTHSCGSSDPIHNYMNYTPDSCMYQFTREQANRMVCSVMTYRSSLFLQLFPPANLTLEQSVNDLILFMVTRNHLSWQANPKSTMAAEGYRLYRKLKGAADETYVQLALLGATELSYDDRQYGKPVAYSYLLKAVGQNGTESDGVVVE